MEKKVSIKGIFLIFLAGITLVLAGCGPDLPPEPGAPGPIGEAVAIYEGYAPPYDVFDGNATVFSLSEDEFVQEPEQNSFDLGVEVSHDDGFIYKYGYYYTNDGWKVFNFPQGTFLGSNWIKEAAETDLTISTEDALAGENYIVAYSCKKYDNRWRCGCTTIDGPCNQWMLQTYTFVPFEFPAEPPPPGGILGGDTCSDNIRNGDEKSFRNTLIKTNPDLLLIFDPNLS